MLNQRLCLQSQARMLANRQDIPSCTRGKHIENVRLQNVCNSSVKYQNTAQGNQ